MPILRGTIVIRTRHVHKNLYVSVLLLSILGLDLCATLTAVSDLEKKCKYNPTNKPMA